MSARRKARLDEQPTLTDLHERLGRALFKGEERYLRTATVRNGNRETTVVDRWKSDLRGLTITAPVATIEAPALADTAFVRALQDDWDATERLLDEARRAYRKHGVSARYIAECKVIMEREDAAIGRAHLATLSEERRAELNDDWENVA